MRERENDVLVQLLAKAQLPALPQSAMRLLELSHDAENGPPEYAVPIEADPGLTSQILRFINSSFFGFAEEVTSVRLAITLVGVKTIRNFALWNAVFSLMPNPKCGPFELRTLWQDSLRRGLFARALGRHLQACDPEELFTAALLQDLAVPLLAAELPDEYSELLTLRGRGQRLSQLEQERFGWTHGDAAALVTRRWRLPASFAANVAHHSSFSDCRALPSQVVGLSALLPTEADNDWSELAEFQSAYDTIGAASIPVADLFAFVDHEFAEFAPVLQLAGPTRSLACWLDAMVVASA